MNRFSAKFLALYGLSLVAAVVLFNRVTAYGESALKAPAPVSGIYPLETEKLPSCFAGDKLVLIIEQSGVYIRGQLLPQSLYSNLEEQGDEIFALAGKFKDKNFNLSGKITECNNELVTLTASPQNNQIMGQFKLNSSGQVVNFIGEKKETTTETKPSH